MLAKEHARSKFRVLILLFYCARKKKEEATKVPPSNRQTYYRPWNTPGSERPETPVCPVASWAVTTPALRRQKTLGRLPIYHRSYRVQPADQRARAVPGEYLRSAIECDQTWNGTLPGSVGTFEAYLRSLPSVIGLGFGGYGEWSKEVDTLIGQLAEIASGVPERRC